LSRRSAEKDIRKNCFFINLFQINYKIIENIYCFIYTVCITAKEVTAMAFTFGVVPEERFVFLKFKLFKEREL
jgi:hypothetical protein